ncbi:M48 family metalloprotease [Nocardioides pacificus]
MMRSERGVGVGTLLVGGAVFVLLAVWLVPWQPVPGGSVAALRPEEVFTSDQIARAEEYSRWARVWSWSSLALSLMISVVLGFSRAGQALMRRIPGPWWLRVVLGVTAVLLVGRLLTLPLGLALLDLRRDYGLSAQTWGTYLADEVRNLLVSVVVSSVVLLVLVGSARRWRRAWPAVAGTVLGALVLVGSFVYPVLVEPLFHDFDSLPEGQLRAAVLEVAEREGVDVDDVLVADASRRTTTLNAYISGLGSTRRVVLYDNLVEDVPQTEVLSVVAHELAHAEQHDVLVGTGLGVVGVLFAVGLLGALLGRAPGARDGAEPEAPPRSRLADPAVVPLVLALVAVGTLLASPVENGISRQIETRADVVALEATGDPDSFVAMQRQLSLRSLADPTPPRWSHFWFGSHPLVLERMALAER